VLKLIVISLIALVSLVLSFADLDGKRVKRHAVDFQRGEF